MGFQLPTTNHNWFSRRISGCHQQYHPPGQSGWLFLVVVLVVTVEVKVCVDGTEALGCLRFEKTFFSPVSLTSKSLQTPFPQQFFSNGWMEIWVSQHFVQDKDSNKKTIQLKTPSYKWMAIRFHDHADRLTNFHALTFAQKKNFHVFKPVVFWLF